jgi:hypothetical protein
MRLQQNVYLFLTVTMLTALVPLSLQAENLAAPCTTNTLAFYEGLNSDHRCSVGILNFESPFSFSSTSSSGITPLTASQIEITPATVPGSPLDGGFSISAELGNTFDVPLGQSASYTIDWFFVIDDGPEDDGADLGLDPPFGNVNVTQTYCVDSSLNSSPFGCYFDFPSGQVTPQTLSVDDSNPPRSLTTSVTFATPALSFADVQTVITLNGLSGFDAATGTASIVDVTPEPAAFLLGAGGLLLIGVLRRRAARV